jgi:hypothetical protein
LNVKLIVTTGSFIAGVVIDDETKKVTTTDHFTNTLMGMTEAEVREHCRKNGWGLSSGEA